MGCDIHAYSETKTKYGWWELHGKPNDDRNYNFFGIIAGVRRDDNTIFEPRGIPKGLSSDVEALYEHWKPDAHSESYLTLADLKSIDQNQMIKISGLMKTEQLEKCKADFAKGNYDSGHLYPYCQGTNASGYAAFELEIPLIKKVPQLLEWIEHLEKAPGTDEEKRIVFWFDN
jgi:hypothetical protein